MFKCNSCLVGAKCKMVLASGLDQRNAGVQTIHPGKNLHATHVAMVFRIKYSLRGREVLGSIFSLCL